MVECIWNINSWLWINGVVKETTGLLCGIYSGSSTSYDNARADVESSFIGQNRWNFPSTNIRDVEKEDLHTCVIIILPRYQSKTCVRFGPTCTNARSILADGRQIYSVRQVFDVPLQMNILLSCCSLSIASWTSFFTNSL